MTDADLHKLNENAPFGVTLGVRLLEAGPELVRGRLEWLPELCTVGDVMHGGAIMGIADQCGGLCAFLNLPEGASGTATIESKTNFLRAVRRSGVTAVSRPLHRGRTLAVVETELSDDDGRLAVKVTQTQIYHY